MANDNPEGTSDDSQVPFISSRNDAPDPGVAPGMDELTPPSASTQDLQQPAPVDEPAAVTATAPPVTTPGDDAGTDLDAPSTDTHPDMPWVTAGAEDPVSTGEMETIAVSETPPPLPPLTDSQTPQTTTFDYDDYYGATTTPPRPEPVSARIEPKPETSKGGAGKGVVFFFAVLLAGVIGSIITLAVLAATGTFTDAAPVTETAPPTTVALAPTDTTVPQPVAPTEIVYDGGAAVNPTSVARKVVPSVVTVNVFQEGSDGAGTLLPTGSGSGVVMSTDGYIITNNHVVEDSTDFQVTFEDGRRYTAELVGTDALTDLAVLKISADDLVPIEFGSSDALSVGDPAIAVGNPLGQEGGASVSVGIISAFERTVEFGDSSRLFGMLQTDAAINSGSSGGALVDAEGKLIGITSAIGVSQAGPEGIGYAIPVELVHRITSEIIETGDVEHPFLGVTIGNYVEEAPDGAIVPAGAEIQTIEGSDTAAAKAGLEPGDVIVQIGDKEIKDQTDLILAVRLNRVGDEVQFRALRNGELLTFDVIMGKRPAEFGG